MNAPSGDLPNQAAPVTLQQLREALAFITEKYDQMVDGGKNVFVWLWEAIQGDFNQNRSTGQIVFDTAISIIPGVDQVCDVRDIVANCKQINEDKSNTWAWVALVLTLIGLFPSLGSLVKGVLKIFFLFVRRMGGNHIVKAVDEAMTWVITFLRRREVMRYWKQLRWDRLFHELAQQVRQVRGLVNTGMLLRAFDRAIGLMRNLLDHVTGLPIIGNSARATIEMVASIRRIADQHIGQALKPVQDVLDAIIRRLEIEDLVQRRGILDTGNIHFTGGLPQTRAVTLMGKEPPPAWLSEGKPTKNFPLDADEWRTIVDREATKGYPNLSNAEIKSFAEGMRTDVLKGPKKLYRIVSPGNLAASADWMTEETFNALKRSSTPKTDWRKQLAVWPDWNPNGQFVIYELKAGEELKVWRGPAAAQTRDPKVLPNRYLEGGYEQIKFPSATVFDAQGNAMKNADGSVQTMPDSSRYHRIDPATGTLTPTDLTYPQWKALPEEQQSTFQMLRTEINHPKILGPFDTKWGYTDFDEQLHDVKLGLPNLPGQVIKK